MSTQAADRIKSFYAAKDRRCPPVRESEVFYRDIIPFPRANACDFVDPWSEEFHLGRVELPGAEPSAGVPEQQQETPAPPEAAAKALFLSVLNAARQHFSEFKLTASVEDLHALMLLGRERTVPAIARVIGVENSLSDILQMTAELFQASPVAAVDDISDTSLVVTVNVGGNANVDLSRQREREWYDHLVKICPSADGRVFLFVNYE
jgi:hypothetical protein